MKERVCSLRPSAALALLISAWDTSAPFCEHSTFTPAAFHSLGFWTPRDYLTHTTGNNALICRYRCRVGGSSLPDDALAVLLPLSLRSQSVQLMLTPYPGLEAAPVRVKQLGQPGHTGPLTLWAISVSLASPSPPRFRWRRFANTSTHGHKT